MPARTAAAGTAIGVLGCAIGVVYPREKEKILGEIRERGAGIAAISQASRGGVEYGHGQEGSGDV
jgi:predicted Rossmann fold nucleotide-binding protein DprA/Smf involved in DNA uptake